MNPSRMSQEQANETLNANAHFANHLYSFITSMSPKCAVQLEIADAIRSHGKPMTLSDLAVLIPIHPEKAKFLPQLMRILTHSGYFTYTKIPDSEKDNTYGYSLTIASQILLKDHPFSMKPYLLFVLDSLLIKPWLDLSDWFKTKDAITPFESSNGMSLWECTSYRPKLNDVLNDTMASDSKMLASVLMSNLPLVKDLFGGVNTLVDVGGGLGEMVRAVSKAFPEMKCMVLDLPHVVDGVEGTHNLSFVAGDMFEAIPPTNAILLKWILHDWSDEYSVKILKQCKRAITSKECEEGERKVIIIDIVVDENEKEEDYKKIETQLFYDMEMMTLVGGKERTKREWEKLFLDAGFIGGFKIFPLLGFRSVIEVYP